MFEEICLVCGKLVEDRISYCSDDCLNSVQFSPSSWGSVLSSPNMGFATGDDVPALMPSTLGLDLKRYPDRNKAIGSSSYASLDISSIFDENENENDNKTSHLRYGRNQCLSSGSSSSHILSAPLMSATSYDDGFFSLEIQSAFSSTEALNIDDNDNHWGKAWVDSKPKYAGSIKQKRGRKRTSPLANSSLLQMSSPKPSVPHARQYDPTSDTSHPILNRHCPQNVEPRKRDVQEQDYISFLSSDSEGEVPVHSNPAPTHSTTPSPHHMQPPPRIRHGYWNRRGDHLTLEGYIVYATPETKYPTELAAYPAKKNGYRNHEGKWCSWAKRLELPDSLPRKGRAPKRPYESFVVYVDNDSVGSSIPCLDAWDLDARLAAFSAKRPKSPTSSSSSYGSASSTHSRASSFSGSAGGHIPGTTRDVMEFPFGYPTTLD